MTTFWTVVVTAVSNLFETFLKFVSDTGKTAKEAEIAKAEVVANQTQTEILVQDRTKDDIVKKMEDGSF